MTTGHRVPCLSPACEQQDILSSPHLRVQISNPDQPWVMLRFCDLICLTDWIEAECTAPQVFTKDEWIDSHA